MNKFIYWDENWQLVVMNKNTKEVIMSLDLPKVGKGDHITINIPCHNGKVILGEIKDA